MANRYPVGRSSYSDGTSTSPFGKVQNVSTAIVARQVASLAYEFDTQFPGARARGDRLTVNEAIREDARALQLYTDYTRDPAHHALAAYASKGPPPVITTTHRAAIGTALDFGITQKDGTNRAMTGAEAAWVDRMGPRRGIYPTGNSFARPESWHKNGGYAYSVAPITGVNQPGAPFYNAPTAPAPAPRNRQQEDDMRAIWNHSHTQMLGICGGKILKFNKDTPVIGASKLTWKQQANLFERACRVDPMDKSYPGDDVISDAENDLLAAIIGRFN